MSSTTADHTTDAHHESHDMPYPQQLRANRLGLWMFFISELFLFGALLSARFYLWQGQRPALSQEVGLAATIVLLVSSLFVYRGETAMEHGDRAKFLSSYLWGSILGILFLISVVVMEWNIFGLEGSIAGVELFGHLSIDDGVFAGIFFAMTGMHALHVITGVTFLMLAWNHGRKGGYSQEKHWGVEATALYWHYVDVVWVFFYPALYLIGTAV